jgi:hypothetical protein
VFGSRISKKARTPFLKKRAKNFYFLACVTIEAMVGTWGKAEDIKVFCFFSSEKKGFLASV